MRMPDYPRNIKLHLSGDITICSNHRRNTENIRSTGSPARRGYSIRKSTRRALLSSAFLLFLHKKHKLIFLTATFPKQFPKDVRLNPLLHKFIANLTKNYGMGNYIWTREKGEKHGRDHFHLLCDLPFHSIQKLNSAWCSAIGMHSPNALRLPERGKSVVNDLERTVKYLTKYITKGTNVFFKERAYGRTKQVIHEPVKLSEFDWYQMQLDLKKDLKFRYFDHCITVKVWDFFKKSDYFIEYLGNYSENSEYLHNRTESVEKIEVVEPEIKPFPVQLSLFNSG